MDQATLNQLQTQLSAGKRLDEVLPALLPDAGDNPTLSLMTQWLAQRSQGLSERLTEAEAEEPSELAALHHRLATLNEQLALEQKQQELRQEQLQHFEARLQRLTDEVDWYCTLLDELALALGACPACWGEDQECRLCRGRGQPGLLAPDPEAFGRIVAPVLQRWPQAGPLADHALPSTTPPMTLPTAPSHAAAGPVRPARMTP